MRLVVPFGTRPEIIKLAPVVAELRRRGHDVWCVATGQHDLPSMSSQFFDELGLVPDEVFELPPDPEARLGALMAQAATCMGSRRRAGVDLALLLGDTFTVPVFALAARRSQVPVAHVEAGLRSMNPTSMEEVNRRVGAACCSLHFAPTELAARFLLAEGVAPERVRVVGNPVIDALRAVGAEPRPAGERAGVLVTAHRATNVDDPDRLRSLVDMVVELGRRLPPVTFPVHPRTADRLRAAGLDGALERADGVRAVAPLPYRELLDVLSRSLVAVTDSGGVQEEAAWLRVPVVVLRRSTPRWEGVVAGSTVLVGVDAPAALRAALAFAEPAEQERVGSLPCPYGDGTTAARIADVLEEPATARLLEIGEPDYRSHLPDAVAAAARPDGRATAPSAVPGS